MTTKAVENRANATVPARDQARFDSAYLPAIDIRESENELTLLADMPGVKGEDIQLHLEKGELSICARAESRQPEGARYLLREYGTGDYFRSFRLSEELDESRISAEYKNGVLELHLPKVEAAKPRKIDVKLA